MSDKGLLEYYAGRVPEYERIYDRPERQVDLARLRELAEGLTSGEDVLEIACGTGYWTRVIAGKARSVLATDACEVTLAAAREKGCPAGEAAFRLADAYRLEEVPGSFTAGFAAFWWSHVPRERLGEFLDGFHRRLGAGARAVFIDNRFVPGSSTPIAGADAAGNTYQDRRLAGGSLHRILKNFPDAAGLRAAIEGRAREILIEELPHYWCLSYRIREFNA